MHRSPSTAKNAARGIPVLPPAGSGRGGYYQDDGPGDNPPPDLLATPDAEPKIEPYLPRANRPYVVFGQTYTPITDDKPFKQRGIGSWYGKKFHHQKTSSGELYDMYKMTAAHPTLPIPSYARVTNLVNNKQVIVRINDRGPFHSSRIIDLSYTAALKLGYLGKGSGELEVERLLPIHIAQIQKEKQENAGRPLASADPAEPDSGEHAATALPELQAWPSPVKYETAASGFYLQLGAYGQAYNAQALRSRLLQRGAAKLEPMEVVQTGALFRLYCGPYASQGAALEAAQQVPSYGGPKPLIVQR
ncbi:MAG TPA: septal ring lytic transglycosylase RlpA family protein [Paucimonas sp.]|nr:septal ring lytic transglycosylase RlpA family protein [Paucimonas sp.]